MAALENQIQWYDDIAAKNPNWYILKKYIDEGITGTQAKKRPAFLQMVQDAKQKKFDLIVTREVCRFARNTVDTLVVTRELKNYGVEVYFVEDNIRTMDGDGELRLTIMATLAQEESRKISERVRAGQKISRDKGVLFGNGNILGYDRDKAKGTYVINPEQAETVRMIYDMYSAGKGMSQIRNELIRLKRKDSSGLVRWENCKIARILHNSTYKGYPAYLKSRRNNFLDQKIIRNRDEDTYREAETVKDQVTEQLAKLDEKLKKLTRMRLEDEITRESYFEFKSEIEKEKLDLLSKRRVLDAGMVPNGNPEDPAKKAEDFLLAKMDFTDHRIDRDVIGQFVGTIVPVTETCFNWYMKFDLADKSDDMKRLVWEFTIDYKEAKSYRKERDGMLRQNQWHDLTVRVFM